MYKQIWLCRVTDRVFQAPKTSLLLNITCTKSLAQHGGGVPAASPVGGEDEIAMLLGSSLRSVRASGVRRVSITGRS